MTTTLPSATPALASPRGLALGVAAYTLFAIHDAMVKAVIVHLPVTEILLLRSLVIMLICIAIGRRQLFIDIRHSKSWGLILGRASLTAAAWCMYYSTGRELQLAQMTTLYYFAPVLTMVLAVFFLKERLTLARVGAAAIGFFGVLVACNPTQFDIGLPTILVLSAAFCWSVAMIFMRTIRRDESALVQIVALNAFNVVVVGALSIGSWETPSPTDLALILGTGIVGGLAQYALVEAARMVPATVLGTVEYSALVWSFVFGYLFWHEEPAAVVYIGALLIVAAGIMVALNESRRARVVTPP